MRVLPTLTILVLSAATVGLLGGCSRSVAMGMECADSGICGEGICLKGVCSGYDCATDADCSNGYVCGSVQDTPVCVLECSGDEDCAGDQVCDEVDETLEDDGPTNLICL